MSLINDALKNARENHTPRARPNPLPPMPLPREPRPVIMWLVLTFVILLIAAAIFFIAWVLAQHSVQAIVTAPPDPVVAKEQAAEMTLPIVAPAATARPPTSPSATPILQGIFYSPTAPAAIVDGKTVEVGDHYLQYRVTEITKYTVTLTGADGQTIKLGMSD